MGRYSRHSPTKWDTGGQLELRYMQEENTDAYATQHNGHAYVQTAH